MNTIEIKNFGPIEQGKIGFGDITFFVGPQASGKSIVLQLLKLLEDKKVIREELEKRGYVWAPKDVNKNLDLVFGEGMNSIWKKDTVIHYDGKKIEKNKILEPGRIHTKTLEEHLFYIPAQRVLCISNGWPRFFTDYEAGVPFVVKHFSETLRRLMEDSFSSFKKKSVFPQPNRLKKDLRNSINDNIYHEGTIELDVTDRKRFVLKFGKISIPFTSWSAGQKEFLPLLLSMYWLCPPAKVKLKSGLKYVVIEEPEMGLHPKAIITSLLNFIELVTRGYKVVISTHSSVLLEFAWAIKYLQASNAPASSLFELFKIKKNAQMEQMFKELLKSKTLNSYFFEIEGSKVNIKDISSLDAGSEDKGTANFGGLTDFASVASELVSKYVTE